MNRIERTILYAVKCFVTISNLRWRYVAYLRGANDLRQIILIERYAKKYKKEIWNWIRKRQSSIHLLFTSRVGAGNLFFSNKFNFVNIQFIANNFVIESTVFIFPFIAKLLISNRPLKFIQLHSAHWKYMVCAVAMMIGF